MYYKNISEEVIVDVGSPKGIIDITIHWKGRIHSQLQVRMGKRGQNCFYTSGNVSEIIKSLFR